MKKENNFNLREEVYVLLKTYFQFSLFETIENIIQSKKNTILLPTSRTL